MSGRDLVLVLIICVVWAGNFLFAAYALQELPPFLFTALRLALLALVLGAFVRRPPRGQWPLLLAIALCMGVLHFGLSFWSLQLAGDLSSVAIVMQSYVPMAALLAWWWLGERFAWRTALAILASFAGVLVLGFDPMVLAQPAALAVMLFAAFFLASGTVMMRKLKGMDVFSLQGWIAIIGVLPLFGLSLLIEPDGLRAMREASWVAWGGVAFSALCSSLLGHGLYYVLLQRHPVAQVTPWLLLAPMLAVGLGIAFYGDNPGPQLWLGGAMVLGGVLLIALRARVKERPMPESRGI